MKFKFTRSNLFNKELKRLSKKYKGLESDIKELESSFVEKF